jgi:hypothetical protein
MSTSIGAIVVVLEPELVLPPVVEPPLPDDPAVGVGVTAVEPPLARDVDGSFSMTHPERVQNASNPVKMRRFIGEAPYP